MNKIIEDFIGNSAALAAEIEEELCRYPAISPDSGGGGELDKCEALERLLKKTG